MTAHAHAAGVLLIAATTGRVLLLRRTSRGDTGGLWGLPGGGIEPGESEVDAVKRELEEETGYDKPIGQLRREGMTATDDFRYAIYSGVVRQEFRPQLNEEHSKYRWTSLSEIPWNDLHPGLEAFFDPVDGAGRHLADHVHAVLSSVGARR